MKKQILLLFLILSITFSSKADTFIINMFSFMGSSLNGSGWVIRDSLGNELASDFENTNNYKATTITITGGPYTIEGHDNTMSPGPSYDEVIFEVLGSDPITILSVSIFDGGVMSSSPFYASIPQPVKFGNFEVKQSIDFDYLHFNTISENNCDKYIIQKSSKQLNFVDIGEIKSKSIDGSSNVELNYEYKNYAIQNGDFFYRIKQLDLDGKFSYSKIVSISRKEKETTFKVYPNPIRSSLNFEFEKTNASLLDVSISNCTGFFIKKIYSGIPVEKYACQMNDLPIGVYFIRVAYDNEVVFSKIVVKE